LLNLRVFQQYLRIPAVHRAVFGGKRAIEFDPSLALGCLAGAPPSLLQQAPVGVSVAIHFDSIFSGRR
jgi:hypothetical protein